MEKRTDPFDRAMRKIAEAASDARFEILCTGLDFAVRNALPSANLGKIHASTQLAIPPKCKLGD